MVLCSNSFARSNRETTHENGKSKTRKVEIPPSALCRRNTNSKRCRNSYTSSMGGKSRTRPYYFRRCKSKITCWPISNIDSLSDDLLVNILARVPADDLHERAMFVSRRWYHIIRSDHFVSTQVRHSTYGLLLHHRVRWDLYPVFVTATQGRIEARQLQSICRSRCFLCANNGLALDFCLTTSLLNIMNVATRQRMALPSYSSATPIYSDKCGIAYAPASMKYKVAVAFTNGNSKANGYLNILTVGVDKLWRNVEIQHLPEPFREHLWSNLLITEGFIHWAENDGERAEVVTLDVESEIITWGEVPLPQAYLSYETIKTFLPAGRLLTLLVAHKELSWEIWGKESRSGEWSKVLPDIELGGEKLRLVQLGCGIVNLNPLGWVKYPQVLAFYFCSGSCTCIVYNLDTHEINSIQLDGIGFRYTGHVHKNNLIWMHKWQGIREVAGSSHSRSEDISHGSRSASVSRSKDVSLGSRSESVSHSEAASLGSRSKHL